MKELLTKQKQLVTLPRVGEVVEGTVIEKGTKVIYFDLGPYGTAICWKSEFYDLPEEIRNLKEGDKAPVKIIEQENEEGLIEVSLRRAGDEKNWDYVRSLKENGEPITVRIIEANRGGLLTKVRGIDAFLPVSQLASKNYPDVGGDQNKILEELKRFIGTDLVVSVIGIEEADKKIILSERADELKEIKTKLKKYKIGDIIEGTVCGVVDYGAFVKFDKVLEGLVHISELDWQLIEDPRNVIRVGQKVKAKVIGIDGDQVSLSLKALKTDPWQAIAKKYKPGSRIEGEVIKHTSFGVFVKVSSKIQALVPLSTFKRTEDMKKLLKIGGKYLFKIFSLEPERHRMALSLIKESTTAPATASKDSAVKKKSAKKDSK